MWSKKPMPVSTCADPSRRGSGARVPRSLASCGSLRPYGSSEDRPERRRHRVHVLLGARRDAEAVLEPRAAARHVAHDDAVLRGETVEHLAAGPREAADEHEIGGTRGGQAPRNGPQPLVQEVPALA